MGQVLDNSQASTYFFVLPDGRINIRTDLTADRSNRTTYRVSTSNSLQTKNILLCLLIAKNGKIINSNKYYIKRCGKKKKKA